MTAPSLYSTNGLLNYAVWLEGGTCDICKQVLGKEIHKHPVKYIPNLHEYELSKGNPWKKPNAN